MSCNSDILTSKVGDVVKAILKKECMTEEVIEDINTCNLSFSWVAGALKLQIDALSCSKLKGRFMKDKESEKMYIEIPIVSQLAVMISDFLTTAQPEENSVFFPPRPEGAKNVVILTPHDARNGRHPCEQRGESDEVSVSLEGLSYDNDNHTAVLKIDVHEDEIGFHEIKIVMAIFAWN